MEKHMLLIVEDEKAIRDQMKWALDGDYRISLASDRRTALEQIRAVHPMLIVLDLGLPPDPRNAEEGLAVLGEILRLEPSAKVVVITGNQDRANALKAIDAGAFDFFSKPADLDEVKAVLRRALLLSRLEQENAALREQILTQGFEEIVSRSPGMEKIFAMIRKVATTDVSVLVAGKSGTGKELVARAIHQHSNRREKPIVIINCGAIPENLLESELFGHEKGSFTGADSQRRGKIEFANEGTLFLDEIGDLSASLQVKLLRFLQEHQIERIGGRKTIPVDVRVIAATNRDLKQDVAQGRFREDLFYRLGVVTLSLPALKDRREDLLLLARTFLQRILLQYQKNPRTLARDAEMAIEAYDWPGNVRELENRVKRAVIMGEGKQITAADLELESPAALDHPLPLRAIREQTEKAYITKILEQHRWNISQAALKLGISRPTLHDLVKKYQISRTS